MGARALQELGGVRHAVNIVGDDFRKHHPAYNRLMKENDQTAAMYTDRDSGRWVEMAIAAVREARVSMVIEGTMRDVSKVADTLKSLSAAGYTVEARALAVPHALSWQAVLLRYERQRQTRGTGRMTTAAAHDAAYSGAPVTLARIEVDGLAHVVAVHGRGGRELYRHDLASGKKIGIADSAAAALQLHRDAALPVSEQLQHVARFGCLVDMMREPARQAAPGEIHDAQQMHADAARDLLARVFEGEPKDRALIQFPQLGGAYELQAALEKSLVAQMQGASADAVQRAVSVARSDVANRIRVGALPVDTASLLALRLAPNSIGRPPSLRRTF